MATNMDAPEDTFSAKPFYSKDGVDDNGQRAEVKIVLGYGVINSSAPSKKGNSTNVSFAVRNTEHFPSGWTRDEKVLAKVKEAEELNVPIHFRIETRRKDHVDRSLPMSEVAPPRDMAAAKDNTVKSLAAVRLEEDSEWTISKDAVTRLDEDPRSNNGLHSAYDHSPEELKPQTSSAPKASNNGREPAPYIGRLATGEVNPGSTALLAILGFFNYLLEYEREEGVEIEKDKRKEMARTLMLIANKLQLDIYKKLEKELKGGVDLTAGSHTRARALIFESIRSFAPITESVLSNDETYKKWQKTIYSASLAMWEWAIEESEEFID